MMNLEQIFENTLKEAMKLNVRIVKEQDIINDLEKPIYNIAWQKNGRLNSWSNYNDMPFKLAVSWAAHFDSMEGRTRVFVQKTDEKRDTIVDINKMGKVMDYILLPRLRPDLIINIAEYEKNMYNWYCNCLTKISKKYEN